MRISSLNLIFKLPYCSMVLMLRVLAMLPMADGLKFVVNTPEFWLLPWLLEKTPGFTMKLPKNDEKLNREFLL